MVMRKNGEPMSKLMIFPSCAVGLPGRLGEPIWVVFSSFQLCHAFVVDRAPPFEPSCRLLREHYSGGAWSSYLAIVGRSV